MCDNRSCFHGFVCVISNRPISLFRRLCTFLYQQRRYTLLSIFYPTIQLATACITLRLMYTLFRNIANGRSPLTKQHARILAIIASLLLVSCLVEIVMQLIPAVSEHIFQVGSFAEVGYVQDPATSSLHIDLKTAVMAAFCYAVSAVFSYGADLQQLSDETI